MTPASTPREIENDSERRGKAGSGEEGRNGKETLVKLRIIVETEG